ncbi:MAG: hypothetical protein DBX55_06350 [Verrucomicrobia bacterium]|nr:MAG: hypothetical protein DBX55_06350 [Verrucomicrobiota bacterium]
MRFAIAAVFALACAACIVRASAAEMSLAEKIALAKRVADDAAAGKIASGMVVDSSLNLGEIINRYRESGVPAPAGEALSAAMESSSEDSENSSDGGAGQNSAGVAKGVSAVAGERASESEAAAPKGADAASAKSDEKTGTLKSGAEVSGVAPKPDAAGSKSGTENADDGKVSGVAPAQSEFPKRADGGRRPEILPAADGRTAGVFASGRPGVAKEAPAAKAGERLADEPVVERIPDSEKASAPVARAPAAERAESLEKKDAPPASLSHSGGKANAKEPEPEAASAGRMPSAAQADSSDVPAVEPISAIEPISPEEPGVPKPIPPKSEKLLPVDTSKNFVNGFYVGDSADSKGGEIDASQLPKKRISEFKNSLFKIYGEDFVAVNQCAEVAKDCAELAAGFFSKTGKLGGIRPVELRVLSESESGSGSAPLTGARIMDNGAVVLSALWCERLDFDLFCRLLSGGALRSIAFSAGGVDGVKNLPYWLELAFEGALEQKARFGVARDMARLADANPPLLPESVFSLERGKIENFELARAHAYWNLEALREILGAGFPDFFSALLIDKKSPEAAADSICGALKMSMEEFHSRWRCVVTGLICSRLGGIQTMEATRAEIVRYAVFPHMREDGTTEGLAGMSLFEMREDPDVRNAVELRIFELKVALSRSNSVYHNALVALGRSFEALLDDDADAYRSGLTDFTNELKTSDKIADKVRQLMLAPSPEDYQSKEESGRVSPRKTGANSD